MFRRAFVLGTLFYGLAGLGANPVLAESWTEADRAALMEARTGEMQKLVVHREPRPLIEETFRDEYGNGVQLADFAGDVVVVNFWATWCPPCRKEMPSIDRLAGAMADEDVSVVALSMDRFGVERVKAFFDEIGVENLVVHQDRTGAMARRAGALGLPVTIVLDRQGREIARLTGEAEWDSPDAKAVIRAALALTAPGA